MVEGFYSILPRLVISVRQCPEGWAGVTTHNSMLLMKGLVPVFIRAVLCFSLYSSLIASLCRTDQVPGEYADLGLETPVA